MDGSTPGGGTAGGAAASPGSEFAHEEADLLHKLREYIEQQGADLQLRDTSLSLLAHCYG